MRTVTLAATLVIAGLGIEACGNATGPTGVCPVTVSFDVQGASGGTFHSLDDVTYINLFQGAHQRLALGSNNKDFSRSLYILVGGVAGTGSFSAGLASYEECSEVGFLGCSKGKDYSSLSGDPLSPGAFVVTALDVTARTISGTFTFSIGDGIDHTNFVTIANGTFSGCITVLQD